jgi:hypothetical protein
MKRQPTRCVATPLVAAFALIVTEAWTASDAGPARLRYQRTASPRWALTAPFQNPNPNVSLQRGAK